MALTPEGTPYVESTDLVANYPAASLSLANRVDLVGVLPFADAAARTTALPSPTDGQYSYLQDTNLTEFYDGSNWITTGGNVLLQSGTLTGASVSLSAIPQTYKDLKLVVFNYRASAATNLNCNFNSDTATRYSSSGTISISNTTYGDTALTLTSAQNSSTSNSFMVATFFDYIGNHWKLSVSDDLTNNSTTAANLNYVRRYGAYNQTTAITSITLSPLTGTFSAGTYNLYGVN